MENRAHYIVVELRVTGCSGAASFALPTWTPGAYNIQDYAGRVHGMQFTNGAGRRLAASKVDKTTWRTDASADGIITASYKVFALEHSVVGSYVDDHGAMVNGAGVYLYMAGRMNEPLRVTFRYPRTWASVTTGLDRIPGTKEMYFAVNYDQLVDCPVMLGNHHVERFEVDGVPHRVVMAGSGKAPAVYPDELLSDIQSIVEAGRDLFGTLPYAHYTFFLELGADDHGGLEHANSTHIILPRTGFADREDYVLALAIVAHEFFHCWNVKRLRPPGLGPFDYTREVHTQLLWFVEGLTNYYHMVLLLRAGCISGREFLDQLGRELLRFLFTPGRRIQSVEEASFTTWIKSARPSPDSPNTTVSYYNKGCLIGMALDLEIRRTSRNRASLDDVMRLLVASQLESDRPYTMDDVEAAAAAAAGGSLRSFFDEMVRSRREVRWDLILGAAGLRLLRYRQEPEPAYLGIRVQASDSTVTQVLATSPAQLAGLAAGDELIGANGNRLDATRLERWLLSVRPGETVQLTIARGGLMRELSVVVGKSPRSFSIAPRRRATTAQRALCLKWLEVPWSRVDRPVAGLDPGPRGKFH